MDIHIFILSTMTPEMTSAFFESHNVAVDASESIHRHQWKRGDAMQGGKMCSLWITHMTPLTCELLSSTLPYMDAAICLYHDDDALSCVKVRNAEGQLSMHHDNIWLLPTCLPAVTQKHNSRIKKFYNKDGFERPQLRLGLQESIENILLTDFLGYTNLGGF